MLDRLYEQRKAITDFLMLQADKGTPLCNLDVSHWQLMCDTCRLLRPFEEATLFVSRQDYGMNDVIPLLHVLEQMLLTMAGQGARRRGAQISTPHDPCGGRTGRRGGGRGGHWCSGIIE
ncbi:unnamed protein product [Staurois parvus]|uniref:Uncharacterized protein n=1 Tax=Staurois parvus TaxID=386267 RepID=A0ABN9HVK3_9NEOB|nr:unnamed protein product [Staurois parvus]